MKWILAGALACITTPTIAEVVTVSDTGFVVSSVDTVPADPAETWAVLRAPARYWNKDHSWTGDAANLWMDAQTGGCFCEKIPGKSPSERGSVEHARIIYAAPGKLLRLRGALGPLQGDAVTGTLSWTLEPVMGGTRVTMRYVVGGYREGGLAALAQPVDQVMTEQLMRLKAAIEESGIAEAPIKSAE